MERPLDLEAIFPIKDAESAALMTIKADCLRKASLARQSRTTRNIGTLRSLGSGVLRGLTEAASLGGRRRSDCVCRWHGGCAPSIPAWRQAAAAAGKESSLRSLPSAKAPT